jgi:hypothetical protein
LGGISCGALLPPDDRNEDVEEEYEKELKRRDVPRPDGRGGRARIPPVAQRWLRVGTAWIGGGASAMPIILSLVAVFFSRYEQMIIPAVAFLVCDH